MSLFCSWKVNYQVLMMTPTVCENMPLSSAHPRIPTMAEYRELTQNNNRTGDNHIRKSGLLSLQTDSKKRMAVRAQVYNNGLDHFILLGSNKSVSKSSQKYINLRNTQVLQEGDNSIRITPNKHIDGESLVVTVSNTADIDSWLLALKSDCKALGSPIIRRSPLMTVLQETDEE